MVGLLFLFGLVKDLNHARAEKLIKNRKRRNEMAEENIKPNTNEVEAEDTAPIVDDSATKEIERLKGLLSKANSEAAENKRKLREKMSEEEKARAEAEENQKAMMAELESYRKATTLSNYEKKFMASGFDSESATAIANSLVDGNMDDFFATLGTFTNNVKKSAVADAMASQSGISIGSVEQPQITQEQFNKMDISQMLAFKASNPELFVEYAK